MTHNDPDRQVESIDGRMNRYVAVFRSILVDHGVADGQEDENAVVTLAVGYLELGLAELKAGGKLHAEQGVQ